MTVSSAEEAVDAVRLTKREGATDVKFYTSIQRASLLPAVAEARELQLHLHGHIPAAKRPTEVSEAGYDEIT